MVEILVDRLLETAKIDPNGTWEWSGALPFTLEEVLAEKKKHPKGTSKPYGDTFMYPVKKERDKNYHILRIIYFTNHYEEINGITVYAIPNCEIVDGWHRLAAAIILKLQKIYINFNGSTEIKNYLIGESLCDMC